MKEERIEVLKNIRASLVEFTKSEVFGEWDTNGREIRKALDSLAIAIKDSELRAEKRYMGTFLNVKTREYFDLPFYSKYRTGSYMNESNAFCAKIAYCKEQNIPYDDIKFVEAYREKTKRA